MITIIYSTHKDEEYNSKFKEHLTKSNKKAKKKFVSYNGYVMSMML